MTKLSIQALHDLVEKAGHSLTELQINLKHRGMREDIDIMKEMLMSMHYKITIWEDK